MAVKLRLRRMGKKKQPVYRVVAADARSPRDGKFIETIGTYNPLTDPATIDIKEERALYWLNVGAQPTITVKNLLSQKGILYKREMEKQGLSEEQIVAKMEEWVKMQEARLAAAKQKAEDKKKKVAVKEEVVEEKEDKPAETENAPTEEVKAETIGEEAAKDTVSEETNNEENKEEAK